MTKHVIVCDRCQHKKVVKGFNYDTNNSLSKDGWSAYRTGYFGKTLGRTKELCPPCTTHMANAMEYVERDEDYLMGLRDCINQELRIRRKENNV